MEIGSEFAKEEINENSLNQSFNDMIKNIGNDIKLLFSGRTAIDYVLEDLDNAINTVYMPGYCCDSMLQPFIDRGIKIEFYEVSFEDKGVTYNVNYSNNVDLFFGMSYFGYHVSNMDVIMSKFREKGVTVIEDITHRLLSKDNSYNQANYFIASIRKWFPTPSGGIAIKKEGYFKDIALNLPPDELVIKKVTAMEMKKFYLGNNQLSGTRKEKLKEEFLSLYSTFNKELNTYYKNFRIDKHSENLLSNIDIKRIREQRLNNVRYIYQNLEASENIGFIFNEVDFNKDCPLFVPLIIKEKIRPGIINHFIKNFIYCPVHWPIPKSVDIQNNIYNKELSLICDHRYGSLEMEKQIKMLGEF